MANVLDLLLGDESLSPEAVLRLRKAIQDYLRDGDIKKLCRGLGLPEPGQRKHLAMTRRNIALWRALAVCEGSNLSQRAENLVRELRRFETTRWRSLKDMPTVPSDTSELHTQLHAALRAAKEGGLVCDIPSERHIVRLVTEINTEMSKSGCLTKHEATWRD